MLNPFRWLFAWRIRVAWDRVDYIIATTLLADPENALPESPITPRRAVDAVLEIHTPGFWKRVRPSMADWLVACGILSRFDRWILRKVWGE